MIGTKPFSAIRYRQPKADSRNNEIKWFVGIDTEAYKDGKPFMICSSEGDIFSPSHIPACFFMQKFQYAHFVLYNMKYDTGAFLRTFLTLKQMKTLARYHELKIDHCGESLKIKYLPHKYLLLQKGKIRKEFWDISQFFHGSLDNAAKTYLNNKKIHVSTKSFSRRYVRKHWKKLCRYCIKDALLTARLADYFKAKLNEFGIEVGTLYSAASLSFQYFKKHAGIIDVYDLYRLQPEVLLFAHEAYQGGKFEVTKRGTFDHAYEYDIVSAYPYEMYNLIDIRECNYIQSKKIVPDAPYAFLRCRIKHIDHTVPSCHGILLNGVRVYPVGIYHATLTLNEYLYLTKNNIDVTILDGWHIIPTRRNHPYQKAIDYLFKIKDTYRKTDKMLYMITKIMMNGLYGRMANLNQKYESKEDYPNLKPDKYGEVSVYDAGSAWNPIYSSMITANTRISVCRLQQRLQDACIATHTDSVITTVPLPDFMLSDALGGLKLELEGPGMILGCGMYDMAEKTAYRGFEMPAGFTWINLLKTHPRAIHYEYRQLRVVSWTQACAWDRMEETNVFQHIPKKISLNSDVKRNWHNDKVRGYHLLKSLNTSSPRLYIETQNPWR